VLDYIEGAGQVQSFMSASFGLGDGVALFLLPHDGTDENAIIGKRREMGSDVTMPIRRWNISPPWASSGPGWCAMPKA